MKNTYFIFLTDFRLLFFCNNPMCMVPALFAMLILKGCFLFDFYMFMCKDGWESRWVKSDWKRSEGKAGSFKHTAGKWSADPDDKGLCFTSVLW